MNTPPDPYDPIGPGQAVLNDPAQYDVATENDAEGFPFVETPGDLGRVIWAAIPGYRSAVTGQQLFGPKRVGDPVFTGGKSADGSPTRAR